MGLVYADIELINGEDLSDARRKRIPQEEIKRMTLPILVYSGAFMLCINEDIQEQLQFPMIEKRTASLASGQTIELDVVSQVELRFKNRRCLVEAMVLPGKAEPLLGVIPLENMDVLIDPLNRALIVNPAHPDMAQMMLK